MTTPMAGEGEGIAVVTALQPSIARANNHCRNAINAALPIDTRIDAVMQMMFIVGAAIGCLDNQTTLGPWLLLVEELMNGMIANQGLFRGEPIGDCANFCKVLSIVEDMHIELCTAYCRASATLWSTHLHPTLMAMNNIVRGTWVSESMPAGLPTYATWRLAYDVSSLQLGAIIDASCLAATRATSWIATALSMVTLSKHQEDFDRSTLSEFVVFLALPITIAESFIRRGRLELRHFPMAQVNCSLSIDGAFRKLSHWLAQGHMSEYWENPIAIMCMHLERSSLTAEMKQTSGVGGQWNWHNVCWIGSSYATISPKLDGPHPIEDTTTLEWRLTEPELRSMLAFCCTHTLTYMFYCVLSRSLRHRAPDMGFNRHCHIPLCHSCVDGIPALSLIDENGLETAAFEDDALPTGTGNKKVQIIAPEGIELVIKQK